MDTNTSTTIMERLRASLPTAMRAPWYAGHPSTRLFALCTAATFGAAAVLRLVALPGHKSITVLAFCLGVAAIWAGVLSNLALLAADARRLCLPGVARMVVLSLLAHAAMTLLLAWMLFAPFGVDLAFALLATALAMVAGLCVMLASRWLSLMLGVGAATLLALHDTFGLPGWIDARWLHWGAETLLVLLAIVAWCWRGILANTEPGTALVWQYGMRGLAADGDSLWFGRADSAINVHRLRQAGPQRPRLALRVAFGGIYLPRGLRQHLRALVGLLAVVLIWFVALEVSSPSLLHDIIAKGAMRKAAWVAAGWLLQIGGMICLLYAYVSLRQRWQRAQAELSLLAVLPGLGNTASQGRANLLRAALTVPLAWLALTLAGQWAIAQTLGMDGIGSWLALCPSLAATGLFVALVLRLLAGRRLLMVGEILPPVFVALLYIFTLAAGALYGVSPRVPGIAWVESFLVAGWLVLGTALAGLALRNWRIGRRRPHPFLPTAA